MHKTKMGWILDFSLLLTSVAISADQRSLFLKKNVVLLLGMDFSFELTTFRFQLCETFQY